MKNAGLDTSFLNFCVNEGITGKRLAEAFRNQNDIPYVSPYVIYELARCMNADNLSSIAKGKALFRLLIELSPKFTAQRDFLYKLEYKKLKDGNNVKFDAGEFLLHKIKERILSCSNGVLDFPVNFFDLRQDSHKDFKTIWAPKGAKDILEKKFDGDFQLLIDNLFALVLDSDQYRIDFVKDIISLATNGNILLTNEEIVTIVSKKRDFPVFNALIRSYAYLYFLTEINTVVPRHDRFTDSLIMIEYAYCDLFISNDNELIEKHAKHINPDIRLIKAKEFIKSFNTISKSTDAVI